MTVSAARGLADATHLLFHLPPREISELTSLAKAHLRDGTGRERQRVTAQLAERRPDVTWPCIDLSCLSTSHLKALDAVAALGWMRAPRRMFELTHDAITAKRHPLHHTGSFASVLRCELAHATRTAQ